MMANSKLFLFVLLALVVGAFGRPLSAEQDPDDNEVSYTCTSSFSLVIEAVSLT